ncbi:MAG: phenylacetate--CoA ligase family protein, partial [Planctomycetes bacterium]|nr:phenylacetate--CoA ligase family protein [Planctomycetota bacterium]
MAFADQRRMQDELLSRYVREYVYPFHPYYREVMDREGIRPDQINSVDDLRRFPLTSKLDLLPTEAEPEQFKRFILQPTPAALKKAWSLRRKFPLLVQRVRSGTSSVKETLRREFSPCFMTFTTGRSAEPVPFFYSLHDIDQLHETGRRLIDTIGLDPQFRVANLFPYAPHLAFWQVVFAGFETGMMVLSTGGGRVMGSAGDLRAIARTKANAILGVPGYIYHLLRRGAAEGLDLSSVKTVVLSAERVPPGMKTKIRS